jgi:outer membrane protein assembly factor BamB
MSHGDAGRLSRRSLIVRSAAAAAGLYLLHPAARSLAAPAPLDRKAWLLPGHDLSATRSSPVAVSPGTLAERWRAHLAGGITGAPLRRANTVYAASFGGDVAAFDLATGAERWRRALGTASYAGGALQLGFFGGIAVRGNRAVVASDHVVCLDSTTGETVWEAPPLRASPDGDDYVWAPPALTDHLVLVGSGAGSESGDTRGRLTAYSLKDGSLRWSTPMVRDGLNGGGILGQPTVDLERRRVYVATGAPYDLQPGRNPGTDSVVELSLGDGSILWADQVHGGDARGLDLNSAAVLLGDLLLAAGKDGFRAWNRVTHERLWYTRLTPASPSPGGPSGPTSGPEGGPLATDGVRVYGLSNDDAAGTCTAAALDPATGRVLWRTALPAFSFAAPAVSGDAVAVPGSDGFLRLLAPDSGEVLREVPLGEPSSGAVSVSPGVVLDGTGAAPFLPGDSLVCLTS